MVLLPYLVSGTSNQLSAWVAAINAQDSAIAEFLAVAQPAERAAFETARDARTAVDPIRPANAAVLSSFPTVTVTAASYYDFWRDKQKYLGNASAAVQTVVDQQAANRESHVLGDVLLYGIGVGVLGVGVLILSWIVIRSVNRSLREVTDAATD